MTIITTSRSASKCTLELAKSLALLIPHSYFERRGKKSIEKLFEFGRKKGHSRIVLVSEENSKPAKLQFIDLNEATWNWLPVEFEITSFKISKEFSPAESLQGSSELAKLFEFNSEEGDVLIEESSNKIVFKRGNVALLELRVRKLEAKT